MEDNCRLDLIGIYELLVVAKGDRTMQGDLDFVCAIYDAICDSKVQADLIPVNKVLASTQSRHVELDL